MFRTFTKYVAVFLSAVAITSVLWNLNQMLLFGGIRYVEDYDYIIYAEGSKIIVRNGTTGRVEFSGTELSQVLNPLLLNREGLRIFIKSGSYNVSSHIIAYNCKGVKITGSSSTSTQLNMNGHALIIKGESWRDSINNQVEGLEIHNGSIIIENSFKSIIRNCFFTDSERGIVFLNSNGWTECTLIEECYFVNVFHNIVFKAPINNGTSSYVNTEVRNVYFELKQEGAVGMYVEKGTDFNEGLLQNIRFWMGKSAEKNQTGILIEGSMLNTVLQNVIFESFAKKPVGIYGIRVGNCSDPPIIGQGVVFCGNFSETIYNPHGRWLYGSGGAFKMENVEIPLGTGDNFGPAQEIGVLPHFTMAMISLNAKVQVEGVFSENEKVQVRLRFKFIDDSLSDELILTFNTSQAIWVDKDGWLKIWPTRTLISSLIVDARTNMQFSEVTVKVSVYGQYG